MTRSAHLFGAALLALLTAAGNRAEAQLPDGFAGVNTSVYNPGLVAPGGLFLASRGAPGSKGPFYLQVMNNDGTPQASKKAGYIAPGDDYFAQDFKVLPDGHLLSAQSTGWFGYTDGGTAIDQVLDEDLNLVESIQMGNGYQAAGQDFELLPNGHALVMGYYTTLADLRSILPGAFPRAEVSGTVVQELDVNRNVVWQWRSWDHFSWSEFAGWGPGPYGSLIPGWQVNAVRQDPIDGNLLLATSGEAMKISRQTGDVLWRLGGVFNQFSFVGVSTQEALRQLAGNDFHRLTNGNYILLNNAAAGGSRSAQVHEYQLDEVHKVATHVWQYIPTNNVAARTGGNVQRLPNGNTLIGWGTSSTGQSPDCTEVAPDGRKVFELSFTNALTDSCRAFRFAFPPSAQVVQNTRYGLGNGNTYVFGDTGVTLDVLACVSDSYNSANVAREPYAPVNPLFQGQAPMLLPARVNFSQRFITSLSGVLSFDPPAFSITDPANTTVYYRTTPGEGVFVPLPTQYNPADGKLQAELSDTGFGEFAFGLPDVAEVAFPPLLVEPESLQSTGFVTCVPPLVQTGKTYTVNQQLPVALAWCPKGFASGYALQVSTHPDFSAPVVDEPYLVEARYAFSNAAPNTTYYWRVVAFNDTGLSDWAASSFSTVPPAIHVTAPNGGEIYGRGMACFIQWDDNLLENVTISLYKAGTLVQTLAASAPGRVSYQWQIGQNLVPGNDYSLRIASATNPALFDASDLPFSIVDPPAVAPGSVVQLPDGRVQFAITAAGASSVTVLGSTNLVNWQALQTLPVNSGTAAFTDTSAAGSQRRFYNLRVP
jgi:hypothetical protein